MRKKRRNMTKVVDMDKVVDGDVTTLNGTGINQSETPTEVAAKDLPLSLIHI